VAVAAVIGYLRLPLLRRYLTVLAPAPVVFLVLFLAFSPLTGLFAGAPPALRPGGLPDTPVIWLLLDEMSLASIRTTDGSIDAERFPSFARLAERSTWYPNAVSNSNKTEYAFPTILSGKYPRITKSSLLTAARYPDNLFRLLQRSHRMEVDEWFTALCSLDECRARVRARTGVRDLAADTALFYAHMSAPAAVRARLPGFGLQLGRFLADPYRVDEHVDQLPGPARPLARPVLEAFADDDPRAYEVRRFRSFVRTIRATDEPALWFAHVSFPHFPWFLLPDVRGYDDQVDYGGRRSQRFFTQAGADHTFQRYLLQLRATDVLLGEMMSRIDRAGLWDDSMIVVQADHGATFTKGKLLRSVGGAEHELLPIPLFVKYPGQRTGVVDDRDAQLIDIAPTIADVLDVEIPWTVDGRSLGERNPDPRKIRTWAFGRPVPPFDGPVEGQEEVARRIRRLFGPSGGRDDLFAWGPHRSLVGERVSGPSRGGRIRASVAHPERFDDVDLDAPYLPARVAGSLSARPPWEWVAVAVNGRVAGLGMPIPEGGGWRFAVVASPRFFVDGRNVVEVFGVDADGRLVRLKA
jgi:hypothetical protein